MTHFLLLQLKRIGDTILTAPAVAALKASVPDSRITLVLSGVAGDLGGAFTGADDFLVYLPGRANAHLWARLVADEFDVCLDFTGTDRSALMARLSGAPERIGYTKFCANTWRERFYTRFSDASVRDQHTVDFHIALVREVADQAVLSHTGFCPTTSDRTLPDRFALIHPGTARTEKYWHASRWAEVMTHLAERDLSIIVTGSHDFEEQAHLEAIRTASPPSFTDLSRKLSLIGLADIISRATVALGVDSAAMHLAAVAETPQIVLFGPTNPFHWRPRHPRALVLQAGQPEPLIKFAPKSPGKPMRDLSTDTVIRATGTLSARL